VRLIAVGRIGQGPEAALFSRYNERLRPKLTVTEIADGRGAPGEIRRREAVALLAAVPGGALVVALDLGGAAPDSETFAALVAGWRDSGRQTCFLIGGAEGLDADVIGAAGHVLSLGRLTWPHLLARVLLVEQLYRAQAIATGHPYHRAGRPTRKS